VPFDRWESVSATVSAYLSGSGEGVRERIRRVRDGAVFNVGQSASAGSEYLLSLLC